MGKEEMSETGKGEMEVEGEDEGGERGEQWGRVKETKWAREGEKASQAFSSQGSKGPPHKRITGQMTPVHTLEPPEPGLVPLPRVPQCHPLVYKGSSKLLRLWKIWDCPGAELLLAGSSRVGLLGLMYQKVSMSSDPQIRLWIHSPLHVKGKKVFQACRCFLCAFNLWLKSIQDSWKD